LASTTILGRHSIRGAPFAANALNLAALTKPVCSNTFVQKNCKIVVAKQLCLIYILNSRGGMTMTSTPKAPFKKFDYVKITSRIPNAANMATLDMKATVVNVINTATKKNPAWRIYLNVGLWCDPEVIELTA
jgi:hypothetical protein